MVKFSVYDFLGLLLPGVIFLFFTNIINNLFHVFPFQIQVDDWKINVGIALCFALIIGAVLYASNFYLVTKCKLYNKVFGMYKHVADLLADFEPKHIPMNEKLNEKAQEWFGRDIFIQLNENDQTSSMALNEIKEFQNAYYDLMYYELDYNNKIDSSKTFQSFYFFFRQTVLACTILLITVFSVYGLSYYPSIGLVNPNICSILWLTGLLTFILLISALLAKWYRKRMVIKMYWTYYTHLNQNQN